MARRKHVPQRMCVACRESQAKKTLIRLVRTPDGVQVDPSGKKPGRGAYLHADPDCWDEGLKGPLARSLNMSLSEDDRQRLKMELQALQKENNTA